MVTRETHQCRSDVRSERHMSSVVRKIRCELRHLEAIIFTPVEGIAPKAALNTDAIDRILADIWALEPEISRRSVEIEAERRVPADLVGKLLSIGFFSLLVPRDHGALELDLPAAIEIMERLCRIEGSVGWITTVGMGSAVVVSLLPRDTYYQIDAKDPTLVFGAARAVFVCGRALLVLSIASEDCRQEGGRVCAPTHVVAT